MTFVQIPIVKGRKPKENMLSVGKNYFRLSPDFVLSLSLVPGHGMMIYRDDETHKLGVNFCIKYSKNMIKLRQDHQNDKALVAHIPTYMKNTYSWKTGDYTVEKVEDIFTTNCVLTEKKKDN